MESHTLLHVNSKINRLLVVFVNETTYIYSTLSLIFEKRYLYMNDNIKSESFT